MSSTNSSVPIFRLPTEILSDILLRLVSTDLERPTCSLDTGTAPWTYTRVSKEFRDVSLGTPMLWNRVYLERFFKDKEDSTSLRGMAKLLRIQLHLAQDIPLIIVINASDFELMALLVPLLWDRKDHWRSLTILNFIFSLFPLFNLPCAQSASFPLLETFHTPVNAAEANALRSQSTTTRSSRLSAGVETYMKNLHVFRNAPVLKTLTIGPTPFSKLNCPWTWTGCRRVVLQHLLVEDAPLVLPLALQSAETLSIEYSGAAETLIFPRIVSSACHAPQLTALRIQGFEENSLNLLVAPSLRYLSVSFLQSAKCVQALVQRSRCRLESLIIEHSEITQYSLLLDAVPDLITLCVSRTMDSANFADIVDALEAPSGEKSTFLGVSCPRYVPNLLRAWVKPFVSNTLPFPTMIHSQTSVLRLQKVLLTRLSVGPRVMPNVEQCMRLKRQDFKIAETKIFQPLLPFTPGDIRFMAAV